MSFLFSDDIGFKENAVDAFNRLRTSSPLTVFDSQNRYQINDKWSTLTGGGGLVSYVTSESALICSVTTTSGDLIYRETKKVFPYQPGKSLLILATFSMNSQKTNLRQRIGYFGSENGVYLEQSDDLYFVLRSSVSGSIDESRKIPQSSWNGDRLDGNGPSGVSIDVSKANILWFDVEWLGVGDVRCGFYSDGKPVLAHTFHNDNIYPTTYMTTACLPVRAEIENTGTTTGSSSMRMICTSVQSEAGYQGFSKSFSVTKNGSNATTLTSAGQLYPLISIRLNQDRKDGIVIPASIQCSIEETASNKLNTVLYSIILNGTVNDGSWTTHFNGNVDYNNTASTISGGTTIISGYINSSSSLNLSEINSFNYQLGRTITGASDVFTLAMTPINASSVVYVGMEWYELI